MNEFPGPCPGDKVLLVSAEENTQMFDLLRLVFEQRGCLTIVSSVAEALGKLGESFDLVWLQLPLPDLKSHLFFDLLLAAPDLVSHVGVMDPLQITWRLLDMPPLDTWGGRARHNQKGVWLRIYTEADRNWVRHLLDQCACK